MANNPPLAMALRIGAVAVVALALIAVLATRATGGQADAGPALIDASAGPSPLSAGTVDNLGVERWDTEGLTAEAVRESGAFAVLVDQDAANRLGNATLKELYVSGVVILGLNMTVDELAGRAGVNSDEGLADLQPPAEAGFSVDGPGYESQNPAPKFDGPYASYIARTSTDIFAATQCFLTGNGYMSLDEPSFTARLLSKRGIATAHESDAHGNIGVLACR